MHLPQIKRFAEGGREWEGNPARARKEPRSGCTHKRRNTAPNYFAMLRLVRSMARILAATMSVGLLTTDVYFLINGTNDLENTATFRVTGMFWGLPTTACPLPLVPLIVIEPRL